MLSFLNTLETGIGEDKTVDAGLDSNPVEFDGIIPGIVDLFPDTNGFR